MSENKLQAGPGQRFARGRFYLSHDREAHTRFEQHLHYHELEFQMVYLLEGCARMYFDGVGKVRLEKGSCMHQEPGIRHRLIEWSDDYTVIERLVPADPAPVSVAP